MGVEMTRPVIAYIFQKLHQPESGLRIGRAEAQVLIVATRHLIVQINVEELSRLPRLRYCVRHV